MIMIGHNIVKSPISILFFGRSDRYKSGGSSTEVVEYDFILNELLPKDRDRFIRFIPYTDVQDISNVDVFIYRCRSRSFSWDSNPDNYPWGFIPTFDELLTAVNKVKPKIIIQLSDEYVEENNDIHNQIADKCELFLRQYSHYTHNYQDNTLQIPLRDGVVVDPNKIKPVLERNYNWIFVGQIKSDREEMLQSFGSIPKEFVATEGVSKDTVIEMYTDSIFVPSGRGHSSLDCFRIYEAIMCGAIPVVVASPEEIKSAFRYTELPPWVFADSWNDAVLQCKELLNDSEALQKKQEDVSNWWKFTIKDIQEKIRNALLPKIETIKVVQIGSNRGNDKLSKHLLENYQSLEFGLFVEPNKLHIEKLKNCYRKYPNAIIENVAVKLPGDENETLTIYYHIDDAPDYEIASTKIEHILWHTHLPNRENNYEGKIESFSIPALTIEELFDKYKITELDWLLIDVEGLDADLILTFDWKKYNIRKVEFEFLHLGDRAESIKNMFLNMGYIQVNSLNPTDDWAFVNPEEYQKIHKKNIDKLQNFPPVHFISTIDSEERRNLLYKKFAEYNITNVTPHIFKRYEDGDYVFHGEYIDKMIGAGRGPLTSHLRTIKEWYLNTDEPYAFFCEDDLSFETVQYWNFTWQEFFQSLPKDWECVQLCWVREEYYRFLIEFRHRCWCDWSGCAYLISREYARKVVESYHYDDEFHLDIKGEDIAVRPEGFKIPVIETVIFSSVGKVYGMPLFVEDVNNCLTTWRWGSGNEVNYWSYLNTIDWWNRIGQYLTLDDHFRSLRDKL